MKTLYEILEVSENASNEVIEKAYKVLVKKYHPDLQSPENKEEAETKIKEINEAYEILTNEQKKKEYDESLERKRKIDREHNNDTAVHHNESINTQQVQNNSYNKAYDMQRRRYEEELRKQQEKARKQMEQNMQEQYENAYYSYLRSLGYKIKERWTWQKTKKLLIVLLILIGIIIILWFFPPTHKWLVQFYKDNKIVKIIIDIVVGIVGAFIDTIKTIFSNLAKGKI